MISWKVLRLELRNLVVTASNSGGQRADFFLAFRIDVNYVFHRKSLQVSVYVSVRNISNKICTR